MADFVPTRGFVKIGEFFVCDCGIPLAKRTGIHEYEIIRYHNGKQTKMKTEFDGMFHVKCETCNRGFAYLIVKEEIKLVDNVKVVAEPES